MAQFGATPNSSFTFGAQKTNTPTFGSLAAPQQGSITFGTPIAAAPAAASSAFGTPTLGTGLNFGSPAVSSPFGTTPVKPTGLTFGTPQTGFGASTSGGGFGFGATPASTSSGLTFGTPATSVGTGLSFGASTSGGLFGTPATAPSTGLSFGAQPAFGATPASASAPLSFGATNTAAGGGLSFGATQPAFGAPATGGLSFGTSAPSLGTGLTFGAPTTTTGTLNFSFGSTATTTAPTLNFNNALPFSTTPALNFKAPTSSVTGLNFSFNPTKSTEAATSTFVGLGGVDSFQIKAAEASDKKEDITVKENLVPNEILQTIEQFKQFVKEQKVHISDIARTSARPFLKVREDTETLNATLAEMSNEFTESQQMVDKVKQDSVKCLYNAEIALRTQNTPPSLQYENVAPMKFFIDLVNQFEQDLQALRVQIDITDKHFQSLQEPRHLTSQELASGMRKLHDTFVSLAGRLHSVHSQVETQKEQYLNLRKYILKDSTNVFEKPKSKEEEALIAALKGLDAANYSQTGEIVRELGCLSGPTPFSYFPSEQQQKSPQTGLNTTGTPNLQTSNIGSFNAGNTSFLGQNTSAFNSPGLGLNTTGTSDNSFQLQNPPVGNKRGKR